MASVIGFKTPNSASGELADSRGAKNPKSGFARSLELGVRTFCPKP
jgi:hypothetical protein